MSELAFSLRGPITATLSWKNEPSATAPTGFASSREGDRPIWFAGHWGFQYYGSQHGLREIYPATYDADWNLLPGSSVLEEGDWIIYPDMEVRPYGQPIVLDPEAVEGLIVIEWHDSWPLRTIPEFYLGYQPLRHHDRPSGSGDDIPRQKEVSGRTGVTRITNTLWLGGTPYSIPANPRRTGAVNARQSDRIRSCYTTRENFPPPCPPPAKPGEGSLSYFSTLWGRVKFLTLPPALRGRGQGRGKSLSCDRLL